MPSRKPWKMWTNEDKIELEVLYQKGLTYKAIALQLERSEASVGQQIRKMLADGMENRRK